MSGMRSLTSRQRAELRKLAHDLDPVVIVGRGGVTGAVMAQVDESLAAHELIKVKLPGDRQERSLLAQEVAGRADAHLVETIGRVAILYRRHPDPEKRSIDLPESNR